MRGGECPVIPPVHWKGVALKHIRNNLSEEWIKENFSRGPHHLHHHETETCLCDFGKVGIEKREIANIKRRDFYKTEQGKEIKLMYKTRARQRKELNTQTNLAEMEKKYRK